MFQEPEEQAQTSIGEYWATVRRRRWWILLPLFVCWAIVWGVGWLLPATYKSEALILVEQQKVPEQYVVPNVSVSLQERLQSMTQQILSRTRLQATIDTFHLYPKDASLASLLQSADPVETMRKDIKIELVQAPGRNGEKGELTAFKIQYSAGSPELAQQVNSELTSLFIDENLKSQQQLSESTTAFLGNQLADARAKLEEQEAKVRAFKATHLGTLPTQLGSNVQILSGLQTQLQATQHAVESGEQQKLYLQSVLQQYQSLQDSLVSGDSTVTPPEALENELKGLRVQLADAQSQYTDSYPDVVALKDKIAKTEQLKKQIEDEIAAKQQQLADTAADAPESRPASMRNGTLTPMMQIQSQLKVNQMEIESLHQQERKIQSELLEYQARLNGTPQTEQELADISRGYEESQVNYNSLLQKQNQSQLATSLEQRQQGQQFRIIDPPSMPFKPSAPNHLLVSLGGLILGVAVGAILTAILELTNGRVRREKDLQGLVPARVLVSIPRLSTPEEDARLVLLRWLDRAGVAAVLLFIVLGNAYSLYKG
jgi:polysaccharide chain length determinant protein (PEP-CTERM system associated)